MTNGLLSFHLWPLPAFTKRKEDIIGAGVDTEGGGGYWNINTTVELRYTPVKSRVNTALINKLIFCFCSISAITKKIAVCRELFFCDQPPTSLYRSSTVPFNLVPKTPNELDR